MIIWTNKYGGKTMILHDLDVNSIKYCHCCFNLRTDRSGRKGNDEHVGFENSTPINNIHEQCQPQHVSWGSSDWIILLKDKQYYYVMSNKGQSMHGLKNSFSYC